MPNDAQKLRELVNGGGDNRSDADKLRELMQTSPIESQAELNLQSGAMQQGFMGGSQYDQGLTFGSNQQNVRAANQGFLHEAANAAVVGVANIVPQFLGNLASIADFEDYLNRDAEVGNAITRAMMEWQESNPLGLGRQDMPVYAPEGADIGDREFWMGAGRDLVTSAGSFILTGAATGAVLNTIGKGAQLINGLNSLGNAGKVAATTLNAVGLNQAESIQSAIGVYDQVYNTKLEEYGAKGMLPEEVEQLASMDAASAAALTINVNRLNIPLNLTSSLAFLRTSGSRTALLENPAKKSFMRGIMGEGIQELGEEEVGLIAEQVGLSGGVFTVRDGIETIFSQEGFASGLLGFAGGAIQTAGMNLRNRGRDREDQRRYDEQQAFIKELENTLGANLGTTLSQSVRSAAEQIHLSNEMQAATEAGDYDRAANIGQTILAQQSFQAFETGTTEKVLDIFKNVSNMSAEEAVSKGLNVDPRSDEYFKKKSLEAISHVEKLEKIYNKIPSIPNKQQVFFTQAQRLQYNQILSTLNTEIKNSQAELMAEKENRGLTEDFENTSELTQKLQSYKELQALLEQKKVITQQAIDLDNRLDYIQSEQYFIDRETRAREAQTAQQESEVSRPSQEEYNEFIDNNFVSKERIQDLAKKVKNRTTLSPEEQAMFAGKTAEINQIIASEMPIEEKVEASEFLAKDHESPEEIADDIMSMSENNQVNPIISQQAQIKSDKVIEKAAIEGTFETIRAKSPEAIDVQGETVLAIPLDQVERDIIGTNHTHVIVDDTRFTFVSNQSTTEPVTELEVPASVLEDDFLHELNNISSESEVQLTNIVNSTNVDLKNNRMRTVIQQFDVNGAELLLGKDGNPIEKTNLQTPNGIPFDFKGLNDPALNVGTTVFLTYGVTNYGGRDFETVFVNVKNESGQLIPVTQLQYSAYGEVGAQIFERVKGSQAPIETSIVQKVTNKTNAVRTKNNFGLRDFQVNSAQHLPNGRIYIGQVYNGTEVISNLGTPTPSYRALGDPMKFDGRSFMLVTDPMGNTYPEILYQKKSKDIEIGGKKASRIVIDEISNFLANTPPTNVDKRGLKAYKASFEGLKADLEVLIDLGRRPKNTFNLGFAVNPETNNLELYAKIYDGKKAVRIFDKAAIDKAIGERPMSIKADALVANQPIVINGVEFPTYVDFLVDTQTLQTNLYTKQPFRDSLLKLDTVQILDPSFQNNPSKIAQANTYGETVFRLSPENLDPSYQVWDKASELAWLNTNLPNIPVEVLGNTVDIYEKFGQKAFGAFSEGVIYLANNTESGTAYHEAFHGVFRSYLTEDQQSTFLKGTTEEALAEQFRAYVLTEGNIRTQNSALNNFFNDVMVWIKDLLGLDLLNNLFHKINAGKFSNKIPNPRLNSTQFRLIEGLDTQGLNPYSVQQDLIDMVSGMSMRGTVKDIKSYFKKLGTDLTDFRKDIFNSAVSNFAKITPFVDRQINSLPPIERYLKTVQQNELVNSLGFPKPVNTAEFSEYLSGILANTVSLDEVIEVLTLETANNPNLVKIVEDLNAPNRPDVRALFESTYTAPSFAKKFNRLKENINGELDTLLGDEFYKNSVILNTFKNGTQEEKAGISYTVTPSSNRITPYSTRFEEMMRGIFTSIAGIQGNFTWNLPALANDPIFLEDGLLNENSEFYQWVAGTVQDEYSRIVREANNIFKGAVPVEGYTVTGSGNAGPALFFNTFPFLNDLLWVKTPSKLNDVNLIDLNRIDFASPEFLAIMSENLSVQFATEKRAISKEVTLSNEQLDWFISNSIYANTEVTKVTVGDIANLIGSAKSPDLTRVTREIANVIEVEQSSPNTQKVSNIRELQERIATGNVIPTSIETAYSWNDRTDTVLPLDFPSISATSKELMLENPESMTPNLTLVGMEDLASKYRGKKYFWSPSYQQFLSEMEVVGNMNVNTLTRGSLNLISDAVDYQLTFINQPILKDLSLEYFRTKNLQLAVNNVSRSYKIDDEFIDVYDLGTFEPKAFVLTDLQEMDKADSKEILKSFLYYKNASDINSLPVNAELFSDYSHQFDEVRNELSNAFGGTEFTESEIELINSDYKRFLLSHPNTFFGKMTVEEKQILLQASNPLIEANLNAQELWDYYLSTPNKVEVEDFIKYDFLVNGFTNPNIHSNFYRHLGVADYFREMKNTLDTSIDPIRLENFINQFVSNNYRDLSFIQHGNPDTIGSNKPLFLVSNGNLLKFVNNDYVTQDVSAIKDYSYDAENVAAPEVVNNSLSAIEQSLIEQGVNVPASATSDEVIFEWRKWCNSL